MKIFVLLFIWACVLAFSQCKTPAKQTSKCMLIHTIAKRIHSLVDSVYTDPNKLNSDSVFAFETARQQIQLLLFRNNNKHLRNCLPKDFGIQVPFEISALVARKKFEYIRSSSYDASIYYNIVRPSLRLLRKLYQETKWKTLLPEKIAKFASVSPNYSSLFFKYDARSGDDCLVEALQSKSKCAVSEKCKALFGRDLADKSVMGYHLTHQIMYNMFLREGSCNSSTRYAEFFQDSCAKVFSEYKHLTSLNQRDYPSPSDLKASAGHDLAMEQAFVCGTLGFKEFFENPEILQRIFSWQDKSTGCFMLRFYDSNSPRTHIPRRRLMTTTLLNNGCSSHATGMGAIYYSLYLRYLAAAEALSQLT